jgi:arginine repressor
MSPEMREIVRQTAEIAAHQTVMHLLKKGMLNSSGLLTLHEVKERFSISTTTVARWVKNGAIKVVIKGNKKFYKIQDDGNL